MPEIIKVAIRKKARRGRRRLRRLSRSLWLSIIFFLFFGFSVVGKAASRVRRIVRGGKRSFLKSSLASHLMTSPWSYFRPAWSSDQKPGEDLPPSVADRENIVADPDGKIEKEFQVPRLLRERVAFWVDVYSRYSSQFRIVHDKNNLSLIYGIIDLRPVYRAIDNPRAADAVAYQIEQKVLKELKARLSEALESGSVANMTVEPAEREAIEKFLGDAKLFGAKQLLKGVRTQTGQSDMFVKAIERSRQYLPEIESQFRERGLPVALARLPFVESSFNRYAMSKVGAMGMWQFTADTARIFNPKGTRKEWSDPMRQSRYAAMMFTGFRRKLPDWGIAVTAYNSGAGRLARIVQDTGIRSIEELVAMQESKNGLGFAGRNFFCELLAANLVEAYQKKLFPANALVAGNEGLLTRRVQSLIPWRKGSS